MVVQLLVLVHVEVVNLLVIVDVKLLVLVHVILHVKLDVKVVHLLVIVDVKVMGGSCFKGYNPCGSCASCTRYSYG